MPRSISRAGCALLLWITLLFWLTPAFGQVAGSGAFSILDRAGADDITSSSGSFEFTAASGQGDDVITFNGRATFNFPTQISGGSVSGSVPNQFLTLSSPSSFTATVTGTFTNGRAFSHSPNIAIRARRVGAASPFCQVFGDGVEPIPPGGTSEEETAGATCDLEILNWSGVLETARFQFEVNLGPAIDTVPLGTVIYDFGSGSADSALITSIEPAEGTPLDRTEPVGFSAQVNYVLESQATADLVLQAFDQSGTPLAASDPMSVMSNAGPGAATLVIAPFQIPAQTTEVSVKVLLRQSGQTTVIVQSPEIVYPIATDSITISDIDPEAGTPLVPDDPQQFTAMVDWSLVSRAQADTALRAFDQDDILLASSEFTTVQRDDSPASATLTIPPFTLPDETEEVKVKAVLIDRVASTVLEESDEFIYTPGEDELILSENTPEAPPEGLQRDAAPGIQAKLHYRLSSEDEAQIALVVLDQDGGFVEGSDLEDISRGEGDRTLTVPPFDIPHEAGNLVLKGVMLTDGPLAESNTVDYALEPFDVIVDHIEVVQSVQTEDNSVPLVPGKSSVVRVFPKLKKSLQNPLNLAGTLRIDDPEGGTLATLKPFNGKTRAELDVIRNSPKGALHFLLGPELTSGATVLSRQFVAEFTPPGESEIKQQEGHPLQQTFEFRRSSLSATPREEPWTIEYFPHCGLAAGDILTCPAGIEMAKGELTAKTLPLSDGRLRYRRIGIQPLFKGQLPGEEDSILQEVETIYLAMERPRPEQLAGWFPFLPGERTLTYCGVAGTLGFGKIGRAISMRSDCGEGTVSHEVGHNLGLLHLPKGTGCGPGVWTETTWPHSDDRINDPGFDAATMRLIDDGSPDFMTYCGRTNNWVSAFNARLLHQSRMQPVNRAFVRELTPAADEIILPMSQKARKGEPADYFLVRGTVNSDGTTGEMDAVFRLTSQYDDTQSDPAGSVCIVQRGQTSPFGPPDQEITSFCFEPSFDALEDWFDTGNTVLDEAQFVWKVPVADGFAAITLNQGETELDRVDPSPNTPEVNITSPLPGAVWGGGDQTITFTSTDFDGGPLTHIIFYSPDGGETWLPLDIGLTDNTLTVDTSVIEGGPNVRIRVLTSDGVNTGIDEVGPIDVRQAPELQASANEIDFRKAVLFQGTEAVLNLTNSGSGPLHVESVTSSQPDFLVVGPEAPFEVWPDAPQQLQLRFVPTTTGIKTATLSIDSDDGEKAITDIQLRGEGVEASVPDIELSATAIDFGLTPIGAPVERQLTITNHSAAPLAVSIITTTNPQFSVFNAATPFELAVNEQVIGVRFLPASVGAKGATLAFVTDDPENPEIEVLLGGIGQSDVPGPMPGVNMGGVVNAASGGPVLVPGGLGSVFGADLAAATVAATTVPLPRSLGGVEVTVNGIPAPILFVSALQINFQVPFEVSLDVPQTVTFTGLAPGFVALGQANILLSNPLPAALEEAKGSGSTLPLVMDFGGSPSPAVDLPVQ